MPGEGRSRGQGSFVEGILCCARMLAVGGGRPDVPQNPGFLQIRLRGLCGMSRLATTNPATCSVEHCPSPPGEGGSGTAKRGVGQWAVSVSTEFPFCFFVLEQKQLQTFSNGVSSLGFGLC